MLILDAALTPLNQSPAGTWGSGGTSSRTGSSDDAVAQVNHAGCFEHPGQLECGLARLEPVEQALTRTEYHRADLKIDLVDESCHDCLPSAGGPSGDRDAAPTRSRLSLGVGRRDPVGDEV